MKKSLIVAQVITSALLLGISQQVKADTVNQSDENETVSRKQENESAIVSFSNFGQAAANQVLRTQNNPQITYQNQSRQVTETIYFQNTAGQEIAPPQKQVVILHRVNTLQNGTVINYGAWSKADFAQVKAPEIPGYTPTQPYLDALPANQSFYFIWQYRKNNNAQNHTTSFQPAPVHPTSVETNPLNNSNVDQTNIHHPATNLRNAARLRNSTQYNINALKDNFNKLDNFQNKQVINQTKSNLNSYISKMRIAKQLPQTSVKNSNALSLIGLVGTMAFIGLCGVHKPKNA